MLRTEREIKLIDDYRVYCEQLFKVKIDVNKRNIETSAMKAAFACAASHKLNGSITAVGTAMKRHHSTIIFYRRKHHRDIVDTTNYGISYNKWYENFLNAASAFVIPQEEPEIKNEYKTHCEDFYGINLSSKKRQKEYCARRAAFACVALHQLEMTLKAVGGLLGKDHATISHYKKNHKLDIESNSDYGKFYRWWYEEFTKQSSRFTVLKPTKTEAKALIGIWVEK